MSQYFPKPYESFGGDINVKVDLSNYATKADIKNISHVHALSFAWKSNFASFKTEADKLDIDKLVSGPVDLSKLSYVLRNDVAKKTVYDKSVKIDIDTSGFVLKTKYDTVKTESKNKIPDTGRLVKKLDYNAEIIEIENKLISSSGLATNTALTTVNNKISRLTTVSQENRL